MKPLTSEELPPIRARERAATPGPWAARKIERKERAGRHSRDRKGYACEIDPPVYPDECRGKVVSDHAPPHFTIARTVSNYSCDHEDAAFIAAAREDIPRLLATVDAQAARIAELEAQITAAQAEHSVDLEREQAESGQDVVGRMVTREQAKAAMAVAMGIAKNMPAEAMLDAAGRILDGHRNGYPITVAGLAVARALGLIPSTEKL